VTVDASLAAKAGSSEVVEPQAANSKAARPINTRDLFIGYFVSLLMDFSVTKLFLC
jgi:hypothetical protein